jgi:hypothetical protein
MFRRKDLDSSITAVVFTVPDARLAEMDVATGPCVPVNGARKPLCPPLDQEIGETPRQTAALYTVLTGKPSDNALIAVSRSGKGALCRFSKEFVDAMADANELLKRLDAKDEERGDDVFSLAEAKSTEYDKAWLAAGDWPKSVVSTGNRLTRLAWADQARKLGQELYCWFGPSVSQMAVRIVDV